MFLPATIEHRRRLLGSAKWVTFSGIESDADQREGVLILVSAYSFPKQGLGNESGWTLDRGVDKTTATG
jgi:hypothetical protein